MRLLLAVGLGYFLLQLLMSGIGRMTGFDEAIYLGEVQRGASGVVFSAHRSRGASWLVWPTAGLGASITVTRLWLALISSAGLVVAFRPWMRSIGSGAALAAALFAGCWVSVLFGNEVESSAIAALAAVAATGFAVQPCGSGSRGVPLLALAAAMAVVGLFRPTDVAWVIVTMLVCLPLVQGRRGVASVVAAGVGALVGWLPWVIEAFLRFGGPVNRFQLMTDSTLGAGGVEGTGRVLAVLQYLSLSDGPRALTSQSPLTSFTDPHVPVAVWVGAGLVVAGVAVGAMRPRAVSSTAAVRTAAVGGLVFLSAYVVLTGFVHLRFLLPAWGLAAIPAAEGLLQGLRGRRAIAGLTVAVLLAWMVGQLVTLRNEAARLVDRNAELRQLGVTVGEMVERPCYVYAEREYPNIALASGCRTGRFRPRTGEPPQSEPQALAEDGLHVYGLTREPGPPLDGWPSRRVPGRNDGYRLYEGPSGRSPDRGDP